MKKTISILLFLLAFTALSVELPKKILGQYQAKVEAFEFQDNGRTVKASAYVVSVLLKEEFMYYECGALSFIGTYSTISEDAESVAVIANISNELSIVFDLEITVNKRTLTMQISGLKGVPVTELARKVIVVTRNAKMGRI